MSDVISIEEGEQIVPPLSLEQEIALTNGEYLNLITGWIKEFQIGTSSSVSDLSF